MTRFLSNIICFSIGTIALLYPPIAFDDSSWKNAAESFTVALNPNPRGYESAIVPFHFQIRMIWKAMNNNASFFVFFTTLGLIWPQIPHPPFSFFADFPWNMLGDSINWY